MTRTVLQSARRLVAAGLCLMAVTIRGDIREFQVHAVNAGDQQRVEGAQLSDGRVVFVYEHQRSKVTRVLMRFFNPGDGKFSDPIPVPFASEELNNHQTDPDVAALPDGGYVVAYTDRLEGPTPVLNVLVQIFHPSGQPVAPAQSPHVESAGRHFAPRLARLADRGFVVAFADLRGNDQDIYSRRYQLDGQPFEPGEVAVNRLGFPAVEAGDQGGHDVGALPDGGFVVVFEDRLSEGVYGVQFDSQGAPVPTGRVPIIDQYVFRVDPDMSPAARIAWAPRVSAFESGSYVVAYNVESVALPLRRQVVARHFDGPDMGNKEFEAGKFKERWQDPSLLAQPDRTLVFAWQGRNETAGAPPWSVRVHPSEVAGPHDIPGFVAGPDHLYSRDRAGLIPLSGGGFMVTWESEGQDGDGLGVYARMVAPLEPASGLLSIFNEGSLGSSRVRVRFQGSPFECYQVWSTGDFAQWTPGATFNSPNGQYEFLILPAPDFPPRHYRVERIFSPPILRP